MSTILHFRRLLNMLVASLLIVSSMLTLAPARPVAADPGPTVNGLFHGDGDDAYYQLLDTSYFGSELYAYYDAPTTMLYVALVVDRSINDNVFGASDSNYSGNYMSTAGWGKGGGQQRAASVLKDSEFAEFNFACEVGSAKDWTWQQGYACETAGVWVSDSSCGTSSGGTSGYPPSLQSASSFARNINTYEAQTTYPWNMYVFGPTADSWKSPFSTSDPNTSPPNNPNTVIGLGGYPAATNSGDLSQGPPITYTSTYEWEWSMVYEWSLDLSSSGTDCGSNALYLVTGLSHHSPMKEGTGSAVDKYGITQMETWCGQENDCFPDDGGDPAPFADWGDLPDSYSTTDANSGPSHSLTVSGPYLGQDIQFDNDGNPTTDATGDGSEEDGVLRNMNDKWQPSANVDLNVTVAGATGRLVGWFDWDNDGNFDEMVDFGSLSTGAHSPNLSIPGSYSTQTPVHARFRLFDPSTIPGGTLDFGDYIGAAAGGEVEDYYWKFGPTAVTLTTFTADNTLLPVAIIAIALSFIALLQRLRLHRRRR